jgi:hypothetical protein
MLVFFTYFVQQSYLWIQYGPAQKIGFSSCGFFFITKKTAGQAKADSVQMYISFLNALVVPSFLIS